jgi:hypothetical protein
MTDRASFFKNFFLFLVFFPATIFCQNLTLGPQDLRLELRADGGFHLFIRKKPDIRSVLLTESTRDPALRADNYAYRATEWNPVNGDEIRLINGVPVARGIFSLISSTPVTHPELGPAFQIYIPWILEYGYENGRRGEVYVVDGTYFNIRAFNLPYGDYRGEFADNPFVLEAVQKEPEIPAGNYLEETAASFSEIARQGKGDFVYAPDPPALVKMIDNLLKKETGKSVDIVLCMDTTGSMKPYIDEVRKMLIPLMKETIASFKDFRIGMVLYKDYYDEYLNRVISFTRDFSVFQRNLDAIRPRGGGDVPEAVYEALNEGAIKFPWAAESRLLILIGDAPPHPKPRGKISGETVHEEAEKRNLKISAIILAQ